MMLPASADRTAPTIWTLEGTRALSKDLAAVLNKHSVDNDLNMHDFVLSDLLVSILAGMLNAQMRIAALKGNFTMPGNVAPAPADMTIKAPKETQV